MKKLTVKNSKISGIGLFADEAIKRGEVIMLWNLNAFLISEKEYNMRQSIGDELILTTGVRYVMDKFLYTDSEPRVENYINHSFNPNVLYHCGVCFALKNIDVGEELTVDYKYLLSENDDAGFIDQETGKKVQGLSGIECLKSTAKQLIEILN